MIEKERIVTTLAKAKELRPIVEKAVTQAKEDSVHKRRMAGRSIASKDVIRKLFEEIAPRFVERPGGYTRIVKLGPRRGDGAEMAILEFVDFKLGGEAAATETKKTSVPREETSPAGGEAAAADDDETPKKRAKKAPAKKAATKKSSGRGKAPKATAGKATAKPPSKTTRKSSTGKQAPRTSKKGS